MNNNPLHLHPAPKVVFHSLLQYLQPAAQCRWCEGSSSSRIRVCLRSSGSALFPVKHLAWRAAERRLQEIMAVRIAFFRLNTAKVTRETRTLMLLHTKSTSTTGSTLYSTPTELDLNWRMSLTANESVRFMPKSNLFHLSDQSERPSACVISVECECGQWVTVRTTLCSHPPSTASNGGCSHAALSFSCSACKSHVY